MNNPNILLARQPILNSRQEVIAYELLYRANNTAQFPVDNVSSLNNQEHLDNNLSGDQATSRVLINAFTELDISNVAEQKKVFINFTRNLLFIPPPFDNKHLVIEILEDMEIDNALIQAVTELRNKGYIIALDDFQYSSKWDGLLKLANIVKLDVLALNKNALDEHIQLLAPLGIKLLAEKVETHEMFQTCLKQGFELFQGYFFSKPQMLSGKQTSASKITVMQLLSQLQNPDIEFSKLETIISQDPVLSYKLLRLVNSAAYRRLSDINSIKHAINILGMTQIKSWCSLLALTSLSNKPKVLQINTMIRCKMCQLLGQFWSAAADQEKLFTIGLISNLDAFLDSPLQQLLEDLPLCNDIKQAILSYKGDLGLILQTVIYFERAQWEKINWNIFTERDIDQQKLESTYMEAIQWANNNRGAIL